jgi:hypothetical protein
MVEHPACHVKREHKNMLSQKNKNTKSVTVAVAILFGFLAIMGVLSVRGGQSNFILKMFGIEITSQVKTTDSIKAASEEKGKPEQIASDKVP